MKKDSCYYLLARLSVINFLVFGEIFPREIYYFCGRGVLFKRLLLKLARFQGKKIEVVTSHKLSPYNSSSFCKNKNRRLSGIHASLIWAVKNPVGLRELEVNNLLLSATKCTSFNIIIFQYW